MKIIGTNIYLSTEVTQEDVEILATAWNPYRYFPHTQSSKDFFLSSVQEANDLFDYSLNSKGLVYFIIKNISDDSPLGYTFIKIHSSDMATFQFSILVETAKNTGVYSEMNILRHKYIYHSSSRIMKSNIRISLDQESQTRALSSLYTSETRREDIIHKGTFVHSFITREDWDNWINDPSRENKKNANFIMEF